MENEELHRETSSVSDQSRIILASEIGTSQPSRIQPHFPRSLKCIVHTVYNACEIIDTLLLLHLHRCLLCSRRQSS
jgi:hypothetical protein